MSAQSAKAGDAGKATPASASASEEPAKRRGLGDIMGEIFLPVMPAMIASGILQGITSILVVFDLMSETSTTHFVMATISSAILYFLPFLIAPSTAKAFGTSPYLAIAVVSFFLYPEMVGAMSSDREFSVFGITVVHTTYTSSVIPIILMIWGMSYIHRWVDKVTPEMLKSVIVPTLTVGITCFVGLLVLGPLGVAITKPISWTINTLNDHASWVVPLLIGGFGAILVSLGLSFALFPIALTSMADLGYDTVYGPGMLASNMALAGMALAVALKASDLRYRSFSISASTTALLGVTQPAIYGVALVLRRPFLAVMAGGAAGGLLAGLSGFKVFSLSPAGLTGIPAYVDPDGGSNLLISFAIMIVAFVVAFVVAWIVGFEQPDEEAINQVTGETDDASA
ncbi:MAG: PTS transporter subunit EIIC [Thermomicrobiales bacterium]